MYILLYYFSFCFRFLGIVSLSFCLTQNSLGWSVVRWHFRSHRPTWGISPLCFKFNMFFLSLAGYLAVIHNGDQAGWWVVDFCRAICVRHGFQPVPLIFGRHSPIQSLERRRRASSNPIWASTPYSEAKIRKGEKKKHNDQHNTIIRSRYYRIIEENKKIIGWMVEISLLKWRANQEMRQETSVKS